MTEAAKDIVKNILWYEGLVCSPEEADYICSKFNNLLDFLDWLDSLPV